MTYTVFLLAMLHFMSPLDATNASFIMGFIVLVSSCWDTASQHGKGCNIFVSRLRYSANHNALYSWPIRAELSASQNDELCKKGFSFRKAEHRGATLMYSMWKIMCLSYLKPHKHIGIHQIHKIMFQWVAGRKAGKHISHIQ